MRFWLSVLSATFLSASASAAQEWQYRLTPYVWFPAFDSSLQIGSSPPGEGSTKSFSDIFKGGFLIFGEARRGNAALLGEFNYLKLGNSLDDLRVLNIELGLEGIMVSAAGSWTVRGTDRGRLDVIAGLRYWDVRLGANFQKVGNFSVPVRWTDPIVGIAGRYQITDRWAFEGRADIGGFGVGSEFQTDVQARFGYDFNNFLTGVIGARYLGVDFSNTSVNADLAIYGPFVALDVRF